jgi:hypothetical protein
VLSQLLLYGFRWLRPIASLRRKTSEMIGILITTVGILFLVLGLLGASIEVYVQLLAAMLQQQLQRQLPGILQQGGEPNPGGGTGALFEPTEVLRAIIEGLASSALWLALTLIGLGLIYFGLYLTQRPGPRSRS